MKNLIVFAVLPWTLLAQEPAPASTNSPAPILTIDQIAADVLAGNPEANFYRAEMAAALGERRNAGALANPELAVQAGSKRQQEGGLAGEGLAWSVAVNQTFEFPGRLSLRKSIASRQVSLAELGFAQFEASLAARARQLSFALLSAQERAAASERFAERSRELAAVMVQRDPAGVAPLLETRVLEASAITAMHRSAEAYRDLQSALTELNQLRGAPVQSPIRIAPPDRDYPPPPPLEELLAQARTNNFELKIRRLELEQQGFKVDLAKNERLPSVTVGPFYSEETGRDFERQVGIGLSIPLPVWNRGKGNIQIADARRIQAGASLALARRQVESDVVKALAGLRMALSQMAHWPPDSLAHFKEAAELADRHYRLGAIPLSTYIDLQEQCLAAIEAILETGAEADAAHQRIALLAGWIHPAAPDSATSAR